MPTLKDAYRKAYVEIGDEPHTRVLVAEMDFTGEDEMPASRIVSLFEDRYGLVVPDAARELISFPAEVSLVWEIRRGTRVSEGGEFRLVNLYDALDSYEMPHPDVGLNADVKDLVRRSRYVDYQPYFGRDLYVFVDPSADPFSSVYLFDKGEVYPLQLTYAEYASLLPLTKGFYDWQYLYANVDLDAYRFGYVRKRLQIMIDTLPELFPDHDYTPLMDRYRAVRE